MVTLSKLLFNQCKAFEFIATGLVQEININECKKTKAVLGVLSSIASSIPIFGEYAEKLCGAITSVVEKYEEAKFEETKAKFHALTKEYIQDSKLSTVVIEAVIALSKHPAKIEEIRATSKGEKRPISLATQLIESMSEVWNEIKKEMSEMLFRVEITE